MVNRFTLLLLNARMSARASWKPAFWPEIRSECNKLPRPLGCHNNSCNHQCSTALDNNLHSCLLELLDVAYPFLSKLWAYPVLKVRVPVNSQAFHHNKAAVAVPFLSKCLPMFMAFPVNSPLEVPMVKLLILS